MVTTPCGPSSPPTTGLFHSDDIHYNLLVLKHTHNEASDNVNKLNNDESEYNMDVDSYVSLVDEKVKLHVNQLEILIEKYKSEILLKNGRIQSLECRVKELETTKNKMIVMLMLKVYMMRMRVT